MQLTQKWSLSNRLAHRQAPYTIEYTFPTTWQWRLDCPSSCHPLSAAGGTFGIANSTVTKDVGLGASRQIQMSLRINF